MNRQVPIELHPPSDARLSKLRAMEYGEYLLTLEWEETRGRALREAEFQCSVFRTRAHLDVHHLTYERLGEEHRSDVQVLCRDCHEDQHAELDPKRYAEFRRTRPEGWDLPTNKPDAKAVYRALGLAGGLLKPMPESVALDPEAVNRFRKANGCSGSEGPHLGASA